MKPKIFHRILLILSAFLSTTACCASEIVRADSIEISLLTCSPHDEVYSLYGHTALRCHDLRTGEDLVVNYGMFSFDQPYFIARFVFGITDYMMGITSFDIFCAQYRDENRGVIEQVLNLSEDDKIAIVSAIGENARPENVTYRYNYFYNNCTTRARDIIIDNIVNGKVEWRGTTDSTATFRSMIHEWTKDHRWARLGNDLLLGLQADNETTRSEQQFLPYNLEKDFSHAVIVNNGQEKPLVKQTNTILRESMTEDTDGFPLSPLACSLLIFAITIALSLVEQLRLCHFWIFDTLLMTLTGLAGIILTLMLFSVHPTVRSNLQILLFNPLPLFFVYSVSRKAIKREDHKWWKIWPILIVAFIICSIFQNYAEGMLVLASSLLARCIFHHFLFKKIAKQRK